VAQYADACNLFVGTGLDVIREQRAALADDLLRGRSPGRQVDRPQRGLLDLGVIPAHRVAVAAQNGDLLGEIGVQHVIFNMPNVHELRPLEVFGKQIIPAVAGL